MAKIQPIASPTPSPTPAPAPTASIDFDIVIYGSNVGGLASLIRAAGRRGKRVCVIEPWSKFGGVHAAGLTHLDYSSTALIGGEVKASYLNLLATYEGSPDGKWEFEPKNARRAAETLITQYAAASYVSTPLETTAVVLETTSLGKRIKGVQTPTALITGKVFIDASYEGDVMAGALGSAGYTYGRESAKQYGETIAGYLAGRSTESRIKIAAGNLPGYPIIDDPKLKKGDADDRYQEYNFRLPVTRNPANRIPFNKPSGYALSLYDTELRILAALGYTKFARDKTAQSLGYQATLPNGKINWNALDMRNGNVGYADGNWATRRQIVDRHAAWQQGLMWAIANDPGVQNYGLAALQADAAGCGLCADEFSDSPYGPGWPFWLYVREGRRLKAMYTMTEKDLKAASAGGTPTKATAIARWQYAWDMHECSAFWRKSDPTSVYVEGVPSTAGTLTAIYDIPAECMMPPKASCINLLVPTCSGFSHVGWAAQRLEVAHGYCGEAAGEIAAWACDTGRAVQDYDYTTIRQRLTQYGTLLA